MGCMTMFRSPVKLIIFIENVLFFRTSKLSLRKTTRNLPVGPSENLIAFLSYFRDEHRQHSGGS